MLTRSARADERMMWLVRLLATSVHHKTGFTVAWHLDTVNAFVRAFPEAEKSLRYYMIGAHSSPMLNAAAKRAERAGLIKAGVCGNEDARQYNQRTWCRTWTITPSGRRRVRTPKLAKL